jgi:hypothetical protein
MKYTNLASTAEKPGVVSSRKIIGLAMILKGHKMMFQMGANKF